MGCNGEDQGTAEVDGECHDHGAEYDKRASKKKTKSHIYTILYLVDIVGKAGDQSVCSEGVEFRVRSFCTWS